MKTKTIRKILEAAQQTGTRVAVGFEARSFFIDGGVCQMGREELTIVAEMAVPAERLTVSDAEAELREAEARRVPDGLDMETRRVQTERIRHERRSAAVKLRIARQHAGQAI